MDTCQFCDSSTSDVKGHIRACDACEKLFCESCAEEQSGTHHGFFLDVLCPSCAVKLRDNTECLVGSGHGIYVPQKFVECYDHVQWHVKDEDVEILSSGPDHEYYWEAWEDVTSYAYYEHENGMRYILYQDEDLFAVPVL